MRRAAIPVTLVMVLAILASSAAAGPTREVLGPAPTRVIFAGLSDGRVYQSRDGGATWRESDTGMESDGAVYPLVAGAGRTIYAAPGDQGVARSIDGGRSWQARNGARGPAGYPIYGLAVDPGDGRRVYAVAGDGTFFRSDDGGASWRRSQAPLSQFWNSSANAIQVDPLRPSTLLLTSAAGMVLSANGGDTWHAVGGVPSGENVFAAAFSGADPGVAYAATADGIYQTIDGGWTWERETRGIPGGTPLMVIAVDPQHPSSVVANSQAGGIYQSTDGGTSWRQVGDTGGRQPSSLVFDPTHAGTALAGTDDGTLFMSHDGGAHWRWAGTPFGSGAAIDTLAGAVRGALPTDAVAPPVVAMPGVYYAAQSQHTIAGPFLIFYNRHGGLRIFGLPLTEAFIEHGHTVQFFERAEMIDQGGFISLAHLGDILTGHAFPPATPRTGCNYEVPTLHNLCEPFWSFWDIHDGPLVFGLPISEPFHQQNGDGTGRSYLVQYFKNARLEYHPELSGTSYEVSVGLLGREALERRGWL